MDIASTCPADHKAADKVYCRLYALCPLGGASDNIL